MKLNRIISIGLAILLLFMTVSCAESPATASITSVEMTTTPTVTTTQKTTTTTTPETFVHPVGWGAVREDLFHCTAAQRIAQTCWVNLNHLLAINNEQRALFDGDPSTVYANWDSMMDEDQDDYERLAFSKDVQLWAVEITFENTTYEYYSTFNAGMISVELGNNYSTNKATVTYWGKEKVDGDIMIQLPEKLYWEACEYKGTKTWKAGQALMYVARLNPSNPIVDIQFYGIVVETES